MVDKKEHYERYGWKCNETNLNTLPSTAPEGAKNLAKWLTLDGREKDLDEWLAATGPDNRIHGKFWHIGAWSGRMSHSAPNQANIFAPFHGTPKTAVEEIKARYDARLRALWYAKGHLVGTDAEGIQLRILTHYMKSEEWRDAIVSGSKELKTDIHNLNMNALGPVCKDRDTAKTFIYAWILGASVSKLAEIFSCSVPSASSANDSFLSKFPELKRLKSIKVKMDASNGYFLGLDGRKVLCDSEHLMLAGYLQNGEAVVMKHANVLWQKELKGTGIKYTQVDFVHDEWQTDVEGSLEEAEEVGRIQRQSIETVGKELGLFCPLSGSTKIGKTWADSH
jgi:DNA polymerase-1